MIKNWLYSEGRIKGIKHKCYNFQLYPLFKVGLNPVVQIDFDVLTETQWFNVDFMLFGGIINFGLSWTKKTHHSGFWFELGFFGINLFFQIYDTRHWDDENNCWMKYED